MLLLRVDGSSDRAEQSRNGARFQKLFAAQVDDFDVRQNSDLGAGQEAVDVLAEPPKAVLAEAGIDAFSERGSLDLRESSFVGRGEQVLVVPHAFQRVAARIVPADHPVGRRPPDFRVRVGNGRRLGPGEDLAEAEVSARVARRRVQVFPGGLVLDPDLVLGSADLLQGPETFLILISWNRIAESHNRLDSGSSDELFECFDVVVA